MLEVKVYIMSRKRFSKDDISKIKAFLEDNFKDREIAEIFFQQKSAISRIEHRIRNI